MIQDAASPFKQIGRIVRSHGLDGELKVLFEQQDPEIIDQLNLVYVRNNRGDFIPHRITGYRHEVKGNEHTFFVHFDDIADRTAAEDLKDHGLFLETELAENLFSEEKPDDSLAGFEVFDDEDKSLGLVSEVLDSGAQEVIIIDSESGSLMIPVVDEYVTDINESSRIIRCKNIQQLMDL